ncbi:MAG: tetratricopeptide repeat protein [Desulfovibrio sp.]
MKKSIILACCVLCVLSFGCASKKQTPVKMDATVTSNSYAASTQYIENGEYLKALDVLNQMPSDSRPEVYNSIGICYLNLGQPEMALQAFEKFTDLVPGAAAGFVNLGKSHFALEQYEKAEEAFQEAKALGAIAPAALGLAACRLKTSEPEEALRFLLEAEKMTGVTSATRVNRAIAFFDMRLYSDALVYVEEELAVNSDSIDVLNLKGLILYKQKQFDDAVKSYSMALAKSPRDGQIYLNRGVCYLAMQEFALAEDDFTRTVAYAPQLTQVYLSRAEARYLLEDKVGACSDLAKACDFGFCERLELYQNKGYCDQ